MIHPKTSATCAQWLLQTLVKALVLLTAMASHAIAKSPNNLEDIQRETRIVADVMKSALRDELREGMRVTDVEYHYLARQGVLVSINVNAPWITINKQGDASFDFDRSISIPEIPSMVENILQDLQINIAPYEPETLEELRDLRDEQRELRLEQRKIRANLRATRRSLVRADDNESRVDLDEDIAQLEVDLAEVDAQYESLSAEIDSQYQRLRDYRDGFTPPKPPAAPDLDGLVARTACDYGATLKTLRGSEYLTIAIKRGEANQYYSFLMEHINACSRRDMKPERLLELAYQYQS
ncbi:MAG: hypothetical protein AAF541_14805 [Pseudomonadota bacterium]